jgi:nucleotide-binding universal stress UspA family protein
MNDIIVGVDRSGTARRAAETAASLASDCNENLHLVMCVRSGDSHEVGFGSDRWYLDALSEAKTFLHDLSRELPHDRITTTVGVDEPATTLCDEAKRLDARMIVVGNRRVQGMSRVLGSIAGAVMRHAPCDVLVAHTSEH